MGFFLKLTKLSNNEDDIVLVNTDQIVAAQQQAAGSPSEYTLLVIVGSENDIQVKEDVSQIADALSLRSPVVVP